MHAVMKIVDRSMRCRVLHSFFENVACGSSAADFQQRLEQPCYDRMP